MPEITNEDRANNAINWIENLPNYKQAPKGERQRLGGKEKGYCCLGAGCEILNIKFDADAQNSDEFQQAVGLYSENGSFIDESALFYGEDSLATVNDSTNAGFKRISDLMKTKPDWMFEKEVAQLITEHFEIKEAFDKTHSGDIDSTAFKAFMDDIVHGWGHFHKKLKEIKWPN